MHWKAILNIPCKCSTFLKGPSSQWEGSCLLFGKDCLFLVIESGTNLTTNPAYWNNTFECITMPFYSIPRNIQYHTIPYNTGQLDEAYFCLGIRQSWPEQIFVDKTDDRISHLTFDLQSDKTYFWNPLLLFINSDILIKLDMGPLFNDFFISQIFWYIFEMMTKFYNI